MFGIDDLFNDAEHGEPVHVIVSRINKNQDHTEIRLYCKQYKQWNINKIRPKNSDKKRVFVLDGSNIAAVNNSNKKANPNLVHTTKRRIRHFWPNSEIITYIDYNMGHSFHDMVDNKQVIRSGVNEKADPYILKTAYKKKGIVISNDNYNEYNDLRKNIPLLKHLWISGNCYFPLKAKLFSDDDQHSWITF